MGIVFTPLLYMKKSILVLLLFGYCYFLSAQDTVQIITSDGNIQSLISTENTYKYDNPTNVVRLGLITAVNGYTPIYFERKLLNSLSIETMVGFTYRSLANDFDYLTSPRAFNRPKNPLYYDDIDEAYEKYEGIRKSNIGFCVGITPKIYPSANAIRGFYIGPQVNYKLFLFKVKTAMYNSTSNSYSYENLRRSDDYNIKEHVHQFDFSINLGKNIILKNHITLNVNANIGTKYMIGKREDIAYYGSGIISNYRDYKKLFPYLSFDFSIGGWF